MKQSRVLKAAAATLFLIVPVTSVGAQSICAVQPLYCLVAQINPANEKVCFGKVITAINRDFKELRDQSISQKALYAAVRQACADWFSNNAFDNAFEFRTPG